VNADGEGRGVVEGHGFRFGDREGDPILVAPMLEPPDHADSGRRQKSSMKRRIPTNWSTWGGNGAETGS
jgi:hypothetical protein